MSTYRSARSESPGAVPVRTAIAALSVFLLAAGCARVSPPPPAQPAAPGWSDNGVASWYGDPFHGRLTASGETYDMEAMTAAHRTLPFGTLLRVRNLDNGREAMVRINDRGPFVRGRDLDLSRRAAREIDMIPAGTARVRMTIVDAPPPPSCWEVQVGAFRLRENAEKEADRLEALDQPVRILEDGDGLHRVRLGPLDSQPEAETMAARSNGTLLVCGSPG